MKTKDYHRPSRSSEKHKTRKTPGTRPGTAGRRSQSLPVLEAQHHGPEGAHLAAALHTPDHGGLEGTHGFHPYPGRFHPHLPRTLLAAWKERQGGAPQTVLDPFMGGGTTLVEAMTAGLPALGSDLNPVAQLVAAERTRRRTPAQARQLAAHAHHLAAQVEALRRDKSPPRLNHPAIRRLAPHYVPHLFAELAQWMRLIDLEPPGPQRDSLRAVFSALAVKFSNRESDSSGEDRPVAYPKGAVSRFFTLKCAQLAQAQAALDKQCLAAGNPPAPRLLADDARLLTHLEWGEAHVILTSPPYPGTYHYLEHHRLRMDWLGLDPSPLEQGEIGAGKFPQGKSGGQPQLAEPRWQTDLAQSLSAMARVLKPGGRAWLVLGDWLAPGPNGPLPVDGAQALMELAQKGGWKTGSWASVKRPVYVPGEAQAYGERGKWEHLVELER